MAVALWLTRGRSPTLPVMELDGRTVGDSTAIIAALEERQPDPPLYPSDPVERARALALEDWFDEQPGPTPGACSSTTWAVSRPSSTRP